MKTIATTKLKTLAQQLIPSLAVVLVEDCGVYCAYIILNIDETTPLQTQLTQSCVLSYNQARGFYPRLLSREYNQDLHCLTNSKSKRHQQ